ncbi:MAG: S1 family peptidase [Pseudobdellovibrionaceae bacterium]
MKRTFLLGSWIFLSLIFLNGCQKSKQAADNVKTCVPASEFSGIVGGYKVDAGNYLAKKVVMLLSKKDDGMVICTGTPISKDIILTAAHCVKGLNTEDMKVIFHTDITCESGFDLTKQSLTVRDAIYHDQYSGVADAKDDLALVRTKSPIPNDYQISEIYDGKSELSSDVVTLAGYGVTDSLEDGTSGFLRSTNKSFKTDLTVKNKNIVIDQPSNGICSGDSGGPVFVEVNGKMQIAGVNSIVRGKDEALVCHGSSESMYLPPYVDWIKTQSANLK